MSLCPLLYAYMGFAVDFFYNYVLDKVLSSYYNRTNSSRVIAMPFISVALWVTLFQIWQAQLVLVYTSIHCFHHAFGVYLIIIIVLVVVQCYTQVW